MTLTFLHNDPEFVKQFQTPQFRMAMMYLRSNVGPRSASAPATDQMLHKAGRIEGWMECLDALDALQNPPASQNPVVNSSSRYTSETP